MVLSCAVALLQAWGQVRVVGAGANSTNGSAPASTPSISARSSAPGGSKTASCKTNA